MNKLSFAALNDGCVCAAAYEYGVVKLWARAPGYGVKDEFGDEADFEAPSLACDGIPNDLTSSVMQLRPYLSLQVCSGLPFRPCIF